MASISPPASIPPGARRISIELLREVKRGFTDVQRASLAEDVWFCRDVGVWVARPGQKPYQFSLWRTGVYLSITIQLGPDRKHRKSLLAHRLQLWAWHEEELMQRVHKMRDRAHELQDRADAGIVLTEAEKKELLEAEKYSVVDNWQAGHLDDDPTNNHADNIAPQTARENINQSHARPDRRSNASALSRPVVIASVPSGYTLPFPVGHAFDSGAEAARQMTKAAAASGTKFDQGGIRRSARKGWPHHGVVFRFGARPDDADELGEVWNDRFFLDGVPKPFSSTGRIKHRGIKTRGYRVRGMPYRVIGIRGKVSLTHQLIWRLSNAAWNPKTNRMEAAEIPAGQIVLHGGPGRASDAERRDADGYERNWPVDLRLGTHADNMNDREYERKRKREQSKDEDETSRKTST